MKKIKKTEYNITEDVRNHYRLKKELDDNITKDIRNLFRLKKENEAIKEWLEMKIY